MMSSQVQFFKNAPIKVNFAGLRGDTLLMQEYGWEFNFITERSYRSNCYEIRFTARHHGLNLYLYSGILAINPYDFMKDSINYIMHLEIPIRICAENISVSFAEPPKFNPIVFAYGNLETLSPNKIENFLSLKDCCVFQPAEIKETLIVEPKEVQKYLDLILNSQKPFQKEYREKMRKANNRGLKDEMKRRTVDLNLIAI